MLYGEHKTITFLLIDFYELIKLYTQSFRIFKQNVTKKI